MLCLLLCGASAHSPLPAVAKACILHRCHPANRAAELGLRLNAASLQESATVAECKTVCVALLVPKPCFHLTLACLPLLACHTGSRPPWLSARPSTQRCAAGWRAGGNCPPPRCEGWLGTHFEFRGDVGWGVVLRWCCDGPRAQPPTEVRGWQHRSRCALILRLRLLLGRSQCLQVGPLCVGFAANPWFCMMQTLGSQLRSCPLLPPPQMALYAGFAAELYAWFCIGEIVGRGGSLTGYSV